MLLGTTGAAAAAPTTVTAPTLPPATTPRYHHRPVVPARTRPVQHGGLSSAYSRMMAKRKRRLRLVGTYEIGVMLGVSRQRVYQLTNDPTFPEPAAELRRGSVWLTEDIEAWMAKHPHYTAGRSRDH
jgi:prophage regulatory protein